MYKYENISLFIYYRLLIVKITLNWPIQIPMPVNENV